MFLYLPVENEVVSPYTGPYQAFGLRILWNDGEREEDVMTLPGISTDFNFTLRLASLFTQKQLTPLRLLDVFESLL